MRFLVPGAAGAFREVPLEASSVCLLVVAVDALQHNLNSSVGLARRRRLAAARRSRRPRFRFSAMRGKTKAFESFSAQGWKVEAVATSAACAHAAIRRTFNLMIISIFTFC